MYRAVDIGYNPTPRGSGKKLLKWVEWSSIHDCKKCTRYHARDEKSKEMCEKCFVPLYPTNEEAAFIYMMVRNQFITAGGDNLPMDLNMSTIIDVMNLYDTKDKPDTLRKVLAAGRVYIKHIMPK